MELSIGSLSSERFSYMKRISLGLDMNYYESFQRIRRFSGFMPGFFKGIRFVNFGNARGGEEFLNERARKSFDGP
jgi:hypothetical protein